MNTEGKLEQHLQTPCSSYITLLTDMHKKEKLTLFPFAVQAFLLRFYSLLLNMPHNTALYMEL